MDAALSLLEEGGYSAATTEAIAARAGVAKTTIYRWWPNRAALLVDLLVTEAAKVAPPPETGDGLQALKRELKGVAVAINGMTGRLLSSLLGEAQTDPEVRDALLNRLFYPRTRYTAGAMTERRQQVTFAPMCRHISQSILFLGRCSTGCSYNTRR